MRCPRHIEVEDLVGWERLGKRDVEQRFTDRARREEVYPSGQGERGDIDPAYLRRVGFETPASAAGFPHPGSIRVTEGVEVKVEPEVVEGVGRIVEVGDGLTAVQGFGDRVKADRYLVGGNGPGPPGHGGDGPEGGEEGRYQE
ncbi:MAG: hypothetical protein A2Z04_00500 [Chloroflexi bacterium RBG_16_57_9]|nr:MAG: hypothetical protein A2Z04_00500 [Chloroflexi bacterium RBG_16_57_9]